MSIKRFKGKPNILGDNLRKYREANGYSQQKLSDKLALLGVTLYGSDISLIENNKLLIKDFEIIALCKVLNITCNQLLEVPDDIFD